MRLKALIATGMICTATLGSAAPAHAKSESGAGKAQRCEAAQNGQHRGFSCDSVLDDEALGCTRGYTLVAASVEQPADVNENGWVCRLS
jgi:hypothetical protein